jgi:hypothetical protein
MDRLRFQVGSDVGHYRALFQTGLTASIAANGCIFSASMQNKTPVRALVTALSVGASVVAPFTGAQEIGALAYVARNFSVVDSGVTAVNLAAPNQCLNSLADVGSSMTVLVANATALTVGTRTLDPSPMTGLVLAQPAASGSTTVPVNQIAGFNVQSDQQWGVNLQSAFNAANPAAASGTQEGIVVNIPVLQGAGGTVRYQVYMEWIEYSYGPGSVSGYIG